MTAMNVVIGSDVATVGESAIFVVPRPPLDKDGVFEYLESSVHEAGELRGGGEAGVGGPQLGPADYIDFSYGVLTPEPGVGAFGFDFVEGSLGLLYTQ